MDFESADLKEIFEKCAKFVQSISGKLDNEKLLYIYARYKQVRDGPCNTPKPGLFDIQGKKKWEAWKSLKTKSQEDAMVEYIELVSDVDPDWEDKMDSGAVKPKEGLGVSVSTLSAPTDEVISDDCKTVFDWCKEGSVPKVTQCLRKKGKDVNQLDEEGMSLLHWAADRGYEEMVKVLVGHKADVNLQDSDGQTPLHYAATCGHLTVVRVLMKSNADCHLEDNEGLTPADVAEEDNIREILVAR